MEWLIFSGEEFYFKGIRFKHGIYTIFNFLWFTGVLSVWCRLVNELEDMAFFWGFKDIGGVTFGSEEAVFAGAFSIVVESKSLSIWVMFS